MKLKQSKLVEVLFPLLLNAWFNLLLRKNHCFNLNKFCWKLPHLRDKSLRSMMLKKFWDKKLKRQIKRLTIILSNKQQNLQQL